MFEHRHPRSSRAPNMKELKKSIKKHRKYTQLCHNVTFKQFFAVLYVFLHALHLPPPYHFLDSEFESNVNFVKQSRLLNFLRF